MVARRAESCVAGVGPGSPRMLVKPHLWFECDGWYCSAAGVIAWGDDPEAAYEAWNAMMCRLQASPGLLSAGLH